MPVIIRREETEFVNKNPPITFPYNLDIFQKNAINAIEENEHVFVAAPTSAGKSTVAEYAIAKAISEDKKVIYTSPIKTLSNQKYYDFRQRYDSVGILTGDIKENPDAQCLVMTTEILRNMLFRGNDMLKDIKYVIFDEIHYINDRDRGHVWEETITLLPNDILIVMLSATVANSYDFANWIASIKTKNVTLVETNHRPVPLCHYFYFSKKLNQIMNSTYNFDKKMYSDIYHKLKTYQRDQIHQLNTFVDFLSKKKLFPSIFFSFSRINCEKYASKILKKLVTHEEETEINKIFKKYINGIFKNYKDLGQTTKLLPLLQKGIGFHHSGLVPPLKEIQEVLFSKGLIKILFATETFSVGVNMPTRTVVFTEFTKFDGKRRPLNTSEYLQMAGRAGRRGKDKTGTVIYFPLKPMLEMHEVFLMMTGKSTVIESKLKLNTMFLLKVIQSDEINIKTILNESLLGKELQDQNYIEKYESKRRELEELEKYEFKFIDEIDNYHKLKKELKYARANKSKKIKKKMLELVQNEEINEELIKKIKLDEIEEDIYELEQYLNNNLLYQELELNRKFLTELKFLDECDSVINLERKHLTIKGIVGTEINECNELLLSEIIASDLLKDLNLDEIIGILGIFIPSNEEFHYDICDLRIPTKCHKVLYKIADIDKLLYNKSCIVNKENRKFVLDYDSQISISFVESAYDWAIGKSIHEIYYKNELTMYEGNFVKNITKILNICNEIKSVCELVGKVELLEKIQNVESKLLRDVVSFDSIYI